MVLHAALSPEDAVVVATGADVLVLMIYAYSKFMLTQRWVFRYKDNQCSDSETILSYLCKWYAMILLIYSFSMTYPEGFIFEIFSWKADSSAQVVYVHGNFLSIFEVWCNLMKVNSLKKKKNSD